MLCSTRDTGRFDVGQFLVSIRTDVIAVEFERANARLFENSDAVVPLVMVKPSLNRNTGNGREVAE
jgi:hypothetical protein